MLSGTLCWWLEAWRTHIRSRRRACGHSPSNWSERRQREALIAIAGGATMTSAAVRGDVGGSGGSDSGRNIALSVIAATALSIAAGGWYVRRRAFARSRDR